MYKYRSMGSGQSMITVGILTILILTFAIACGPSPAATSAPLAVAPSAQSEEVSAIAEPLLIATETPQPEETSPVEATAEDSSEDVMMAPPQLCHPDAPQYSPLASDEFWDGEIHSTDDGSLAYAKIEYRNENGQRFDIYVMGSDQEEGRARIEEYVNEGQVCLEAVENTSLEWTEPGEVDTSEAMTELEDDVLMSEVEAAIEMSLYEGYGPFLDQFPSGLVIEFGFPLPAILANSEEWSRFEAQVILREELDPEEIVGLREFMDTTYPQYNDLIGSLDDHDFAEWFLDYSLGEATVHFAMDPPIKKGTPRSYRTWCDQASARVRLTSKLNDVLISLEEQGGSTVGPRRVSKSPHPSSWLSLSRQATGTFNAIVAGTDKDGYYEISAGWKIGFGCRTR